MKRLFIATVVTALTVYTLSCHKTDINQSSCSGVKAAADSTQLLRYAKDSGIHPTVDTSFLYYEIINPGSGPSPAFNSKVFVRYSGRLMDGTLFDASPVTVRFALDSLIKGWQYGLPKIKAGGQIKLLVPSALGYGCNADPTNAPLYFHIYLDSLK